MRLLIIFGSPSVGKTTVGKLIEARTDYKLFHNHMVMDGVMHIFGVGTPSEDRLSKLIRTAMIDEAATSGVNLIFTYVWNFARDKGKQNIDEYKRLYESRGGDVRFVELTAPVDVRAKRAAHPDRKRLKVYAPGPERVRQLEETLDFTSPSPFFYSDMYHRIDTSDKTSEQVAEEIISFNQMSTVGLTDTLQNASKNDK